MISLCVWDGGLIHLTWAPWGILTGYISPSTISHPQLFSILHCRYRRVTCITLRVISAWLMTLTAVGTECLTCQGALLRSHNNGAGRKHHNRSDSYGMDERWPTYCHKHLFVWLFKNKTSVQFIMIHHTWSFLACILMYLLYLRTFRNYSSSLSIIKGQHTTPHRIYSLRSLIASDPLYILCMNLVMAHPQIVQFIKQVTSEVYEKRFILMDCWLQKLLS